MQAVAVGEAEGVGADDGREEYGEDEASERKESRTRGCSEHVREAWSDSGGVKLFRRSISQKGEMRAETGR